MTAISALPDAAISQNPILMTVFALRGLIAGGQIKVKHHL